MTPQLLRIVGEARHHGLDVTPECYPYDAAMTDISSDLFSKGWQRMWAISYGDLQWTGAGERLTETTFDKYRKQGGLVVSHAIPDADARAAIATPLTMIASDGIMTNGTGHLRGAGSYAGVIVQLFITLIETVRRGEKSYRIPEAMPYADLANPRASIATSA